MSAQTILTMANGRGVDLLAPSPADIDFDVIAEHLAKEKRYNGATAGLEYSVAEHSVRAMEAAAFDGWDENVCAYVLLHDAHEALLKDDTTPKKQAIAEVAQQKFGVLASQILEAFALLTDKHDAAIHAAAGLAWPPSAEIVTLVKRYDLIMFVTEWRDLMGAIPHPNWEPYRHVKPLGEIIDPWSWQAACGVFAGTCARILPALKAARAAKLSDGPGRRMAAGGAP